MCSREREQSSGGFWNVSETGLSAARSLRKDWAWTTTGIFWSLPGGTANALKSLKVEQVYTEAAKKIRAMEDAEKANVPIIAVTANAFEEDRKIALEAGMNGHLAKPYDIPMMMETLEKLQ